MHSPSLFVGALALLSCLAATEPVERPKFYFPRQVKRQILNNISFSHISPARSLFSSTRDTSINKRQLSDEVSPAADGVGIFPPRGTDGISIPPADVQPPATSTAISVTVVVQSIVDAATTGPTSDAGPGPSSPPASQDPSTPASTAADSADSIVPTGATSPPPAVPTASAPSPDIISQAVDGVSSFISDVVPSSAGGDVVPAVPSSSTDGSAVSAQDVQDFPFTTSAPPPVLPTATDDSADNIVSSTAPPVVLPTATDDSANDPVSSTAPPPVVLPTATDDSADNIVSSTAPPPVVLPTATDDSANDPVSSTAPPPVVLPTATDDSADNIVSSTAPPPVVLPTATDDSADNIVSSTAPPPAVLPTATDDSADNIVSSTAPPPVFVPTATDDSGDDLASSTAPPPVVLPTATDDSGDDPASSAAPTATPPAQSIIGDPLPSDTQALDSNVPSQTQAPPASTDPAATDPGQSAITAPADPLPTNGAVITPSPDVNNATAVDPLAPSPTDSQPGVDPATTAPPLSAGVGNVTETASIPLEPFVLPTDTATGVSDTATAGATGQPGVDDPDDNTSLNAWVPATISTQSLPTAADATATTATGIPTTLPAFISLPTSPADAPVGSTLIQIGFTYAFNYAFVASSPVAQGQIFKFLPQGVADGLNLRIDQVVMQNLYPYDTQSTLGFITTLATLYLPTDMVSTLSQALHQPRSQLYLDPDQSVQTLMQYVNPAIPLLPGSKMPDGSSGGSAVSSSPSATASGGGGVFNSDSQNNSSSSKGTTTLIALGTIGGAAAYGAAMFFIARRYKRRRGQHRRSSSILDSSEMRFSGSPAFMGGAVMSGGRHTPGLVNGRESRGSGGSAGNSARTAQISGPMMAENSLGWN